MGEDQITQDDSFESESLIPDFDAEIAAEVEQFLEEEEIKESSVEEEEEDKNVEEIEDAVEVSVEAKEEPVESESESEVDEQTATEAADEVEEVDEVDEVTKLREQVNNLTNIINQLASGQKPQVPVSEKKEDGEKVTEQENLQPQQIDQADFKKFFDNFDFDEVTDSQENFVDFMSKFAEAIYGNTINTVVSGIPEVVTQSISQREAYSQLHNVFYETYPELSTVKGYVGQVANEICANNPDMELQQVLEVTAETVRNNLGLATKAAEAAEGVNSRKSPTLPGSKGTRQPVKPVSDVQSQINELIDF